MINNHNEDDSCEIFFVLFRLYLSGDKPKIHTQNLYKYFKSCLMTRSNVKGAIEMKPN